VRQLSELVTQKDDLVAEISGRLKEKSIMIDKLNAELKERVSQTEMVNLEEEIERLRKENDVLRRENEGLGTENDRLRNDNIGFEKMRKEMEKEIDRLQRELGTIRESNMDEMGKMEEMVKDKEDQMRKLKLFWENRKGQWETSMEETQREMEAMSNRLKRIHLDHEEDVQNLRGDIEQLEKIIDGKDELILEMKMEMKNKDTQIKENEVNMTHEWSREYPTSSGNYNHLDDEYQSTLTMTSTKPKRGHLTTSRRMSIGGNEELVKEIEVLRQEKYSEKQEMEYQASVLRDQLRDMQEEVESLKRANKKLGDLLDEEKTEGVKWRAKFKELENQYKDLIEQFDLFTEKNTKEKDILEERNGQLERELEKTKVLVSQLEIRLKDNQNSQNGNLMDLLKGLKEKNNGNEENRDLLLEVIKKVNELSAKSNQENPFY
jgi:chromosome segregation ATPase